MGDQANAESKGTTPKGVAPATPLRQRRVADQSPVESKAGQPPMPPPDADEECIDEVGRESFPASDPPSWTLGVDAPKKRAH